MKININRISNDDMTFNLQEPIAQFGHLAGVGGTGAPSFKHPLSGELMAVRIKDIVQVTGYLQTVVEMDCSRCLRRFEHLLKCSLELTFVQQSSNPSAEDLPTDYQLDAYQAGLIHFTGEEIDLQEALSEQIIMVLPYKPLCGEECKGLCGHCGADLNEGDCRCGDTPLNGPFAVLQQLKRRETKS